MSELTKIDPAYSTTRHLRKIAPEVVAAELEAAHKPEDRFETILFQPFATGYKCEGGLRAKGYFKKNSEKRPLVTVITVVFNGEKHLEETILSVINQIYDNVEYIIIDGGSTDRTLDIVRKYEHTIDYWISERDTGIYNAMNKGIHLATGGIIGLVNADDAIYPKTLANVVKALTEKSEVGFTIAPVELAHENGDVFGMTSPLADNEIVERMWGEMPSHHLGIFVKIDLYKKLGYFKEKYRLRADYEFLLRLLLSEIKYARLDQPVGFFRAGGQSGGLRTWLETRQLLSDYDRPRSEIEYGFVSSIAKMIAAHVLPNFLIKQLKKVNSKSKHKYY